MRFKHQYVPIIMLMCENMCVQPNVHSPAIIIWESIEDSIRKRRATWFSRFHAEPRCQERRTSQGRFWPGNNDTLAPRVLCVNLMLSFPRVHVYTQMHVWWTHSLKRLSQLQTALVGNTVRRLSYRITTPHTICTHGCAHEFVPQHL